jgi:hypothetical protein
MAFPQRVEKEYENAGDPNAFSSTRKTRRIDIDNTSNAGYRRRRTRVQGKPSKIDPDYDSTQRRISADRQDFTAANKFRNIHKEAKRSSKSARVASNDDVYLPIKPTHIRTQEAYAKQGIQPHSTLNEPSPEAKALMEKKELQTLLELQQMEQEAYINEQQQRADMIDSMEAANEDEMALNSGLEKASEVSRKKRRKLRQKTKKTRLVKGLSTSDTTARIRAIRTSLWLWGIGGVIHTFVILPFAILSLFALTVAAVFEKAKDLIAADSSDGIITGVLKWFGRSALEVVGFAGQSLAWVVNKLTGWDPSSLAKLVDPGSWFMAFFAVSFFFALFTLGIIYFSYTFSRTNPLGGKGSGLKMGTLLLCLIGYFIPVLNLFPWFFFWTWAVIKSPN